MRPATERENRPADRTLLLRVSALRIGKAILAKAAARAYKYPQGTHLADRIDPLFSAARCAQRERVP